MLHYALASEDFAAHWSFGMLMLAAAWLQVMWAVAVIVRTSPAKLWAGAILNAGVVVAELATHPAGDGIENGLCLALGAVVAAGCGWLLAVRADHPVRRQRLFMAPASAGAVAAAVLGVALATGTPAALGTSAQGTGGPGTSGGSASGAMPGMNMPASDSSIKLANDTPAGDITMPNTSMQVMTGMRMADPKPCTATPTKTQEAAAVSMVNTSWNDAKKYRSLAAGYVPITPSGAPVVHYLNRPQHRSPGRCLLAGHEAESDALTGSARALPARPNLRHLEVEARRRMKSGEFPVLYEAQLAIAGEHGQPSWAALKELVCGKSQPESRALSQLRWIISRFADAGAPGWAAPGDQEPGLHFHEEFLTRVGAGTLAETIAGMAADLREEYVVTDFSPLAVQIRLAGWQVRAVADARPPHRLKAVNRFPLGRRITDPRVAAPVTHTFGQMPAEVNRVAAEAFAEVGLPGLVLAGAGPRGAVRTAGGGCSRAAGRTWTARRSWRSATGSRCTSSPACSRR